MKTILFICNDVAPNPKNRNNGISQDIFNCFSSWTSPYKLHFHVNGIKDIIPENNILLGILTS